MTEHYNELQLYKTAVNESLNAICILNNDNKIIYHNPAFRNILKINNTKHINNKSIFDFIVEPEKGIEYINTIIEKGKLQSEIQALTDKDELIDCLFTAKLVKHNGNESYKIVISFIDVTKDKKNEHQLKKYREHLEELVMEKTHQFQEANEELSVVNEELRAATEDLSDTQKQLRDANEELQSQNEEIKAKNEELEEAQHQLIELNNTLEYKVEERTEELQAANEELKVSNEELEAERLLIEQLKNQFENIFENTGDGILIAEPKNTNFTMCNQKMCELLGYKKDEIDKLKVSDIHPENEIDSILEKFKKAVQKKKDFITDIPVLRKDGSLFYANISTNIFKMNNKTYLLGVFRNITKLRETQQILKDNLKFQEIIFDTIPNPIFYKDYNGVYQNCNNEFAEKIIGLPKSKILGKTLFEIGFPKELAKKYYKKDIELLNNPGKQIYEGKAKCADGELKTFMFYKSTVYSSSKDVIGIIGIMLDITELKNMNQQLVNASALTAVGQLATGVAHEFNNILTIISGRAQMAKIQPDDIEEHLKTFQLIYEQTNRGKDIVSNLMLFAKPQEPKMQFNDLSYCIDNVIGLQNKQLSLYNIEIIKDFKSLPLLYIDVNQMQQVFLNLLINSIHALKPKGKGIIKITGKLNNNHIEISFYDNGIGIKDENKNKIFNPFFTTKGAAAKDDLQIKGTGLGLSISHKIITNHEGEIYVNSKKNEFTEFIIKLPIPEKQIKENIGVNKMIETNEQISSNLNILVVDDEIEVLELLYDILEISGYKNVSKAQNGAYALELFNQNKFDVVLLDLFLPGMSGEEIFEEMKKINPDIPIIFISGQVEMEKSKLTEKGAYGYLQKPFTDFSEITNILKEIDKKVK